MKNYDVFIVRIIIVLFSGSLSLLTGWFVGYSLFFFGLGQITAIAAIFIISSLLFVPLFRFFSGGDSKTSIVMRKWLALKLWATTLTDNT